jgi:hypothetical protein
MGIRADALCGGLTLLEISRSDQNREAMRHKVFRDLKADALIGAGDECDRFVWHRSPSFEFDAFDDWLSAPTCSVNLN